MSVDLLDVLDGLALQVLGVDLLGSGVGLDDGLGLGLCGVNFYHQKVEQRVEGW